MEKLGGSEFWEKRREHYTCVVDDLKTLPVHFLNTNFRFFAYQRRPNFTQKFWELCLNKCKEKSKKERKKKTLRGVGAGTWGFLYSADMDLGVLLEPPQGSQSSSRMGACTCAFLPSCSSSVTLPVAWIKWSVAFPPGFTTRLSQRAVPHAAEVWVEPRRESRGSAGKTGSSGMDWDI